MAARIDHIAIAVHSLDEAVRLFRDVLGAEFVSGGDDEVLMIRTVQYTLPPGVKIELMQPIDESSYLQAFLDKRGPGFHHLTTFWDDVEAAIEASDDAGFTTTDTDLSDAGWRETYIRPSRGFGTLMQLVDTDRDWSEPIPGIEEEDVLAGRVVWQGPRLVLRSQL